MRRLLTYILFAGTIAACSTPEEQQPLHEGKVAVSLHAAATTARTQLDGDNLTTLWSSGDKIALWAEDSYGSMELDNHEFTLESGRGASGTFSSWVNVMPESEYTYYACYPMPDSAGGKSVSFSIPDTQDGTFHGPGDILLAAPATGKPLTRRSSDLSLEFTHALHALRLALPEDGNRLGERIARIDITFPTEVVGTALFDLTDPQAAPQVSGSNTLSIIPAGGIDASEPALWALFAPCDATGEQIEIDIYSQVGDHLSVTVEGRDFRAGHVTPAALSIPGVSQPRSILRLEIGENNLGQIPYGITLTAVGSDGEDESLEIYAPELASQGFRRVLIPDPAALSEKEVEVRFESADAIVWSRITMPALPEDGQTTLRLDVPYLFAEDFSGLTAYNDEATTDAITLDAHGLPGWTSMRSRGYKGDHINLAPFYAWIAGRYQSRLDTAPLLYDVMSKRGGLKPGSTVDIEVSFTAGAGAASNGTPLEVGWLTQTGTLSSSTPIENICATINLPRNSAAAPYSYKAEGVGADARLSWRTNVTSGSWTTYSYVPIDNICVTILSPEPEQQE